jgi:hypothetical protein
MYATGIVVEDPYEGMSDNDRAYLMLMEEKRQSQEDKLARYARRGEFDRNRRYDEDDRHED